MKQTIPFLLALSAVSMQHVHANLYIQADVGYSHVSAKHDQHTLKDSNGSGRVALGMTSGQARYAVDYTHFGSAERQEYSVQSVSANQIPFVPAGDYTKERTTEIDAQSVGLSAYYDFATQSKITPYVGARLGVNRLTYEISDELQQGFADYDVSEQQKDKTGIGVGVMAGASYRVLPALSVNAGAEYHHLGKIEQHKVNQYGATVGVRYQF